MKKGHLHHTGTPYWLFQLRKGFYNGECYSGNERTLQNARTKVERIYTTRRYEIDRVIGDAGEQLLYVWWTDKRKKK